MATTSKPFDTNYIGQRTDNVNGLERVTGTATYPADLYLQGMLHGKVLRSPHPHARIIRIDTSKAESLNGVKAVFTAADLPVLKTAKGGGGLEHFGELHSGFMTLRVRTVAHDKALHEGHAIAAVAATTPEIAEQALNLIKVDYELLAPVEYAPDSMKPDSPLLYENMYTTTLGEKPSSPSNVATHLEEVRGDVEQGFAEADLIHESYHETKMVHQGYLEPTATVASSRPDGKVNIWVSTQHTFGVRKLVSDLFEIPLDKINVIPLEIGGGFGGKVNAMLESLAVGLSNKAQRPVKLVMDRAEVFRATGPAAPSHITVKTGTKKEGTITACYAKIVMDAGAFTGAPVAGSFVTSFGAYKVNNLKLDGYEVVTNKPGVQAYRAPGGTQVGFAVEAHMDEVAEKLGIDPLEFRLTNAVEEGDLCTLFEVPYNRIGLKEVLRRVKEHDCWTTPLEPGPNRGRGFATGAWAGGVMTSSAIVTVHTDGSVTVTTGQVDLTGIRTTMQQIAAQEMQVPLDQVTVRVSDTDSTPYNDGSHGSRTTYNLGVAVHNACHDALDQLKKLAAKQWQVSPDEIEYAHNTGNGHAGQRPPSFWVRNDKEKTMELKAVATISTQRGGPVYGYGASAGLQRAPQFAAHVVDVEMDPETGKITILRYTSFQDVGKAINPTQVEGQIQGGALQGIGWALHEYYEYDKGILKNPMWLDYRMPTTLDTPMLDVELIEVPASDGPYGNRGVGEVPIIPPPAALANAIYRAAGVRLNALPMTPETVFWAIQKKM